MPDFFQNKSSNFNFSTVDIDLKAVFFDMDGVLFDSMPQHAEAWTEVFSRFNIELTASEPFENEGATASQMAQWIFQKYRNEEISPEFAEEVKKMKHAQMTHSKRVETMPYMPQLVKSIHQSGIECWVVTGSGQKTLLERLESEFAPALSINRMVTANDVKIGKPNPEPYLKALEKSGYSASEVIVIENAPLGVQSAKAAGLFTIAINTGPLNLEILANAGADIVLNNSMELSKHWSLIASQLQSIEISEK